jgi:NAD(P)-dependent dehydrogenase (short-subunit alcohol dehydrogenase family)
MAEPPVEAPRTIAVTGSASGIGAAIRAQLNGSGARVIGIDLHDADIVADLSTPDGRKHAISAVAELAEDRLDGLVSCAGLGPHLEPTDPIVRVNYFGAVAILDGLLPTLSRGREPSAVAISSISAVLVPPVPPLLDALAAGDEPSALEAALPLDGATVYGSTKLAVARAVRRRAATWGEAGVRLNAVAPGLTETPMLDALLAHPELGPVTEPLPIPIGRRAAPVELADAVVFLLGPTSSFIHGVVLFADGGTDALLRPDMI